MNGEDEDYEIMEESEGFWEPRMRASVEMTEQLASEIHEEVQELRKELRETAARLEESMKRLFKIVKRSGE